MANGYISVNCVVCRAFAYQRIYCDDGDPHAGGFVSFDPNIREDLWQDGICSACVCGRRYNWRMSSSSGRRMATYQWKNTERSGYMRPAKEYEIAMLLVTKGAEGVVAVIEDKFTILLECL